MNQFVPDWGNMGDASRPLGEDDDLMELLWCNGHVVMQSQGHRKLPPRPEKAVPAVQEDEAGLWFPFGLADSLEKDIFSDLFCEAPPPGAADKPSREGDGKPSELMPPPKSTHVSSSRQQSMSMSLADNAGELSDLVQARAGKAAVEEGASSTLSAIGASFCGSNRGHEATAASSSGRSNNYCFGATTTTTTTTTGTEPTSTSNLSSKRKRGCSDADAMKQDAESESAALERKPPQKLATVRRSRAAEVHNLSERRRRDRINEKMRALQELIPHCNKTDKASMLDEAIEYLKTLQMQVQMMWMGSGMAAPPVMFPGMHQYLPQMGARMPFMPPQRVVPGAQPGHRMPEHYAHFLGAVNHLQPPLPSHHHQHYAQGLGYYPLGAKAVQQNPALHHGPNGSGGAMPAANACAPGNAMHPNKR
ncbi:hypothetical protein ACQ4PT_044771 [Festuca glaucescens]